ncbi:hypothetical protein JOC85_000505 [Bacillus mesophilus]|uniref:Uncharacterized protein n=1 Tax=Bacillus mesophilus TaxID=1808955 RepID=A0A6M0Q2I1_9BACI|nr:hypothetical protein [Bacillus mesophilus]MBM7659738.1 hypothetical protein [Bacillus mesophilus]NEY70601.1 hypothetical protein [Bacillus mesophilus]
MQKRIEIKDVEWREEELFLYPKPIELDGSSLKAAERVLVDSDQLAFVYILEASDEYVYLSISHTFWPHLKKVLTESTPVKLVIEKHVIELQGLQSEVSELIQNIEGNSNYGDEMVKQVESVFL